MKRTWILPTATVAVLIALPIVGARAQAPAPAQAPTATTPAAGAQTPAPAPGRGGRGGGRGGQAQAPPPPVLTCTSKASATDNIVPAALAQSGFVALFNGKDLTGWQALIDIGTLRSGAGLNPADLLKLSPAEKAAKQIESNAKYMPHWTIVDGVLNYDGKGQNLQTVKEYGDIEMYIDWCVEAGADTGFYLRNSPQVQIWTRAEGSGGLYNNKAGARNPLVAADNAVDHWNTFHIIQRADMVTIWLNGQLIVDNVKMEYYWDYSKPLPAKGNLELQHHSSPLFWKNIYLKEL